MYIWCVFIESLLVIKKYNEILDFRSSRQNKIIKTDLQLEYGRTQVLDAFSIRPLSIHR